MIEIGSWIDNNWNWGLRWSVDIVGSLEHQRYCGRWTRDGSGFYTVKSVYGDLMGFVSLEEDQLFRGLWKIMAPSNAIAVGWKVLLDRI